MFDAIPFEKIDLMPHGIELPVFVPTKQDYQIAGCDPSTSNYDFLRQLCMNGVKKLGIDQKANKEEYYERLRFELKTLKELELVDYILIVWDFINFCNNSKIPVGNGRGSAAGSLVLYCCGVTKNCDPIENGLYFERFLSIDRVNPRVIDGKVYLEDCADIDVDISYFRRKDVLQYIDSKYSGNTAKILTFNTLSSKSCIKECLKIVDEQPEEFANKVTDTIPKTFGNVHSIEDSLKESEMFAEFIADFPNTLRIARDLEGLIKNTSIHASGVAVSKLAILDTMPCQYTKEGERITCWDMDIVSQICVKLDCLGLRCLDAIQKTCEIAKISADEINVNDPKIYEGFQNLNHRIGLFQIEADTNYDVACRVKPNSLRDVSDVVALARPGALAWLEDYISRKESGDISDIMFKNELSETNGILLYQEQTMRVLHDHYGFSLAEANKLRKVIGKKQRDKVGEWEAKIKEAGEERGIDPNLTEEYWKSIEASADYQFNKCLGENVLVKMEDGSEKKIKDCCIKDRVLSYHNQEIIITEISDIMESERELFEIELSDGRVIECSMDHKFMTQSGEMKPMKEIIAHAMAIVSDIGLVSTVAHRSIGHKKTYDLEINHPSHNFFANGLVTSNSHSFCYAYLAVQCMYLKVYYPQEFFTALLRLARFEPETYDIIAEINRELPVFGIELLPPDLVRSENDFAIDGKNIRYGLTTIKKVKEKSLDSLNKFIDKEATNKYDVFMAAQESKLKIDVLASLIQAGTLSSLGSNRVLMVAEAYFFNLLTDREKNNLVPNGAEFDYSIMNQYKAWYEQKRPADNGRALITDKRFATITKKFEPYRAIYLQNKQYPRFADWWFETELLGMSYSQKLSEVFKERMCDSADFEKMRDRKVGRFVGVVKGVEKRESRAGNSYLQLDIGDELGQIHCKMMDTKQGNALSDYLKAGGKIPEKDDIVIVVGSKSAATEQFRASLFVNSLSIANQYIAMKMSDLRSESDLHDS